MKLFKHTFSAIILLGILTILAYSGKNDDMFRKYADNEKETKE